MDMIEGKLEEIMNQINIASLENIFRIFTKSINLN